MKNKESETKKPGSRGESEPLTRRIARFSAFLYLGLAILVVAAAAVGIFSISYDTPVAGEISVPQFSFEPVGSNSKDTDIPVQHTESGVTDDYSQPGETSAVPEPPEFRRPVDGAVTKKFSMDTLVFSETMRDYRVHPGIDLAAETGADVYAFADGKVVSVERDYFYGTSVAVEHGYGAVSYYMNLAPELAEGIEVGKEVRCGDKLGTVGDTARIESHDAPHLHFELRVNGKLTDPETEIP
ncbi:MAG: M23 family metallopeptidase [Clostridia bacterium]|nr:M23 family metallopeptidase [Clostridia bacterium]